MVDLEGRFVVCFASVVLGVAQTSLQLFSATLYEPDVRGVLSGLRLTVRFMGGFQKGQEIRTVCCPYVKVKDDT